MVLYTDIYIYSGFYILTYKKWWYSKRWSPMDRLPGLEHRHGALRGAGRCCGRGRRQRGHVRMVCRPGPIQDDPRGSGKKSDEWKEKYGDQGLKVTICMIFWWYFAWFEVFWYVRQQFSSSIYCIYFIWFLDFNYVWVTFNYKMKWTRLYGVILETSFLLLLFCCCSLLADDADHADDHEKESWLVVSVCPTPSM